MEKRVLLATLLSILVLFLFSYYQSAQLEKDRKLHPEKYAQPVAGQPTPTESSIPPTGSTLSEATTPSEAVKPATGTQPVPVTSRIVASTATSGNLARVDTAVTQTILSATGGSLVSVRLTEYPEHVPNQREFEHRMTGIRDPQEAAKAERDHAVLLAFNEAKKNAEKAVKAAQAAGSKEQIDAAQKRLAEVTALELLPFPVEGRLPPLSLRFNVEGKSFTDANLVYAVSQVEQADGTTTFVYSANAGQIGIEKRFSFHKDTYRIDMELAVRNNTSTRLNPEYGDVAILWEGGLGRFMPMAYQMDAGLYRMGASFYSPDGLSKAMEKGDISKDQAVDVAMIQTKYFLAGLFPQNKTAAYYPIVPTTLEIQAHKANKFAPPYPMGLRRSIRPLEPGEVQSESFILYMGPKEYDLLSSIGELPAQEIIYQKTFILSWIHMNWICIFILRALKAFHRITGNWGVDIIILVVIVKAILYPITLRQHKHQRKMREIQPQMKAIQEKYKANPLEGQRKVSELMKKHGARPTAGCLPALLQMPIFLGLYFTLYYAIELRGAHFFSWINDLSEPDSIFAALIPGGTVFNLRILPLVNALVTYLTMSQTPVPDPKQAQMFKFMPIMMTFLFWSFPSGLVLYWTVQGLIQYVTVLLMEHVHFKEENGGKKDAK